MLFDQLLDDIQIPAFVPVRYHLPDVHIQDLAGAVARALNDAGARAHIAPGMRVCVAAGSREIGGFAQIVRAVCDYVKDCGAAPFVIPAMGSHGGATAQGQQAILESYGITPSLVGAPLLSSMDTVEVARTATGISVQLDKYAHGADFIIPIGRVKPHTDFHGRIESGLCKMLVIGLGKQHGAYVCHKHGFARMEERIWAISQALVAVKPNIMALAVVENCHHRACLIEGVPAAAIHAREPQLLELAKANVGRLPFDRADFLIVSEIGKDISGAGMDPNVTGRYTQLPDERPYFQSIAVLDVTDKSHGNCGGVGAADVTTQRLLDKFSFEASYPNSITVADGKGCKLPVVMPNDRLAIKFGLRAVTQCEDPQQRVRAVWIKNTLELSQFYISEALLDQARHMGYLEIAGPAQPLAFDQAGNLITGFQSM